MLCELCLLIEMHYSIFLYICERQASLADSNASCLIADTGFGLETIALPLTDSHLASSRPQPAYYCRPCTHLCFPAPSHFCAIPVVLLGAVSGTRPFSGLLQPPGLGVSSMSDLVSQMDLDSSTPRRGCMPLLDPEPHLAPLELGESAQCPRALTLLSAT